MAKVDLLYPIIAATGPFGRKRKTTTFRHYKKTGTQLVPYGTLANPFLMDPYSRYYQYLWALCDFYWIRLDRNTRNQWRPLAKRLGTGAMSNHDCFFKVNVARVHRGWTGLDVSPRPGNYTVTIPTNYEVLTQQSLAKRQHAIDFGTDVNGDPFTRDSGTWPQSCGPLNWVMDACIRVPLPIVITVHTLTPPDDECPGAIHPWQPYFPAFVPCSLTGITVEEWKTGTRHAHYRGTRTFTPMFGQKTDFTFNVYQTCGDQSRSDWFLSCWIAEHYFAFLPLENPSPGYVYETKTECLPFHYSTFPFRLRLQGILAPAYWHAGLMHRIPPRAI